MSEPIRGTSSFASEFAARGPRDSKGRPPRPRLRPGSYRLSVQLSDPFRAFDSLPGDVKDYIITSLGDPRRPGTEGLILISTRTIAGDPRDPPRDPAGSAEMLEDRASGVLARLSSKAARLVNRIRSARNQNSLAIPLRSQVWRLSGAGSRSTFGSDRNLGGCRRMTR